MLHLKDLHSQISFQKKQQQKSQKHIVTLKQIIFKAGSIGESGPKLFIADSSAALDYAEALNKDNKLRTDWICHRVIKLLIVVQNT